MTKISVLGSGRYAGQQAPSIQISQSSGRV